MGCTVAELLDRISAKELTEWMAYDQLEPFGPLAVNLNAGLIASSYMNCHLKKGAKTLRPDQVAIGEFGNSEKDEMKPQSVEQQKRKVFDIARAFGAKDNGVRAR